MRKLRETQRGCPEPVEGSGIIRRDRSSLREHLSASRYLLGVIPLNEVHFFMDASAKRHGGGHRLIRHNLKTARFMRDYYSGLDIEVARQAYLEVMIHIAFDAGLIHLDDVRLMSEYTRTLSGKGGPRKLLGRK